MEGVPMPETTQERAVKVLSSSDSKRAIDAIVLAFAADPATRWTWPDAQQYLQAMPRMAQAFGGRAFEHGCAHAVADFSAAALWLPPGVGPDEEALGELLQNTVSPARLEEVSAVLEQMAKFHPSGPHWYLPLIGVDPARQGQGLGSALLNHALQRCDRDLLPAYLESSNSKNIPLYKRHGFEVMGAIQAGSSPTITPMLREPR
jgi:ribosomal protein S18 acetylase RimI-like enzyme